MPLGSKTNAISRGAILDEASERRATKEAVPFGSLQRAPSLAKPPALRQEIPRTTRGSLRDPWRGLRGVHGSLDSLSSREASGGHGCCRVLGYLGRCRGPVSEALHDRAGALAIPGPLSFVLDHRYNENMVKAKHEVFRYPLSW